MSERSGTLSSTQNIFDESGLSTSIPPGAFCETGGRAADGQARPNGLIDNALASYELGSHLSPERIISLAPDYCEANGIDSFVSMVDRVIDRRATGDEPTGDYEDGLELDAARSQGWR